MEAYGNHLETNILSAYAGYCCDNAKLLESSSGGFASILAEMMIKNKGVVYGATYSDDFHSAHYLRVTDVSELSRLKGSKYCFVNKIVMNDGIKISIYEAVCADIEAGLDVLFTGLSCDVAVIRKLCEKRNLNEDRLLLIELLCDGVTNEIVQEQYVKKLEEIHGSKVTSFSVRNKKDGWIPLYIYAKFENGDEHIVPFYETAYGYAFANYKKFGCYSCPFKGKNRYGDITIGDYWGCNDRMREYNKSGVSIIYPQTEKGIELINKIDKYSFELFETDLDYALSYSPRYFNTHGENKNWKELDKEIHKEGIFAAYAKNKCISSLPVNPHKDIVLWGAGRSYHKYAAIVKETANVVCVVDKDSNKWDSTVEYGIICKSPEYLRNKDLFVIITVEDASSVCQIVRELNDMGIESFDHIRNWLTYCMR